MNNELKIFENKEFGQIRTVIINNEPWFVGKDVAEALGYAEPRSAVSKKVDEADRGVAEMETPSGRQNMTIINESGLYALIFGSKLESAKKFKRWVTSEVLPAIRKHGTYMTGDTLKKVLLSPDFLIELAKKLKEEQETRKILEAKLEQIKTIVGEKSEVMVAVQKQQLIEKTPKPTYEDVVLRCRRPVTTTTMAKDFGITTKQLNQILRERGIQYSHHDVWLLYPEYAKMGYTSTKVINGKTRTYWAQKGRLFVREVMKGQRILPIIEENSLKEERNMDELKKCINELQETHTNSEMGQALYEYSQIVNNVAEDYNDDTTVEELRSEHPELDFMDDEEIEEILELARGIRAEERISKEEPNTFRTKGSKLFLDGVELKHVLEYNLKHSAGKTAELTLTLEVNVNQVDFESVK